MANLAVSDCGSKQTVQEPKFKSRNPKQSHPSSRSHCDAFEFLRSLEAEAFGWPEAEFTRAKAK